MDKIWDRKPFEPRRTDKSRTLKKNPKIFDKSAHIILKYL